MNLKTAFKHTHHSFNPFTKEFGHSVVKHESEKDLTKFKSCDGRNICFLKLALSPFSIPLKIARKILRLVTAIFQFLAEVVHVRGYNKAGEKGYFGRLGESSLKVIDRLATLVVCPLNILVARIRYLLGLIHPGIAFSNSNRSTPAENGVK